MRTVEGYKVKREIWFTMNTLVYHNQDLTNQFSTTEYEIILQNSLLFYDSKS